MDVSGIRADIEAAVRSEEETGAFRAMVLGAVRQKLPGKTEGEAAAIAGEAVAAVRAFVEGAPDVVEATLAAAREAGVLERVEPIFETALQYMDEEMDFIPDSLGLAGLLDDAYLIYGLMQEISERHRALAGSTLLPGGVFAVMQDIKRIIGDPTATRLEMAIVAFARRQNVQDTIEQIYRRIGGEGLAMDMPSSVRLPGERSPLADVPDLELGRQWSGG
jgi:uncharacterized membrane protein YkvA (DUF1232 family)